MKDYYTHWEFEGGFAQLVVRENMTSNFSTCKRVYFTMDQYIEFTYKLKGQ